MKNKLPLFFVICLVALFAATEAAAQPSQANGTIVDNDGNPLPGLELVFKAKSNPKIEYTAKTNKKGKYFVEGLFSPSGDKWLIEIAAEGLVPVKMTLESRTVNRVLIGDIRTINLKPNAAIPEVPIKPLGSAKVDFTLVPADQVAASTAPAAAAGSPDAIAQKKQKGQADPWDEALGRASSGDLEGAVPFFKKAIEAEPDAADRREIFAKVLYQLERYPDAEREAKKAIELAPAGIEARMVLYTTYVHTGDNAQAKATLEAARELAPTDVRVLEQLAYLANQSGDSAAAIDAYQAITAADAENAAAWVALGGLHAAAGDLAKSEAAYERVVLLDPTEAHQVFYNLGAISMNNPNGTDADTGKAVDAFRKAIEQKPDYAQAHQQLAFALLRAGDRAGARDSLQAYVKYAPQAGDVAQMQKLIETLGK